MTLKTDLDAFCRAFNARSLDATLSLFADHALYELPLLGQRLFGRDEIEQGLQRIFQLTESAQFEFPEAAEAGRILIAEGRLQAKLHRDTAPVAMPAAVTLEGRDGKIGRLSTYLDAWPYRLWTDGPIFAGAPA